MFIYKITVIPINKVYIGFDSHDEYKKARWKAHCRNAKKDNPRGKLYKAMNQYGVENCSYEVIQRCSTFGEMILSEINYISKYDSYITGLNSSLGGDGLGNKNLWKLTDEEIIKLKKSLAENFRVFNKNKWANTTPEQRKESIKNTHTPEANAARAKSLKNFYKSNPELLNQKSEHFKTVRNQNKEYKDNQSRIFGLLGADKTSKKLKVEQPDGRIIVYQSKNKFYKETGYSSQTVINHTKLNRNWHGYKAWEI